VLLSVVKIQQKEMLKVVDSRAERRYNKNKLAIPLANFSESKRRETKCNQRIDNINVYQ